MQIQKNVPLGPLTTLGVGGGARYFVQARTAQELTNAVDWARSRGLSLLVLGGGSNVLVADSGFAGLAIRIAIGGIEQRNEAGKAIFTAGAGENWDEFVAHTVTRGCAGLECLSGIPGTVGGTPVQNVGAYGQEVADTISEVQVLETDTGQVRELCNEACGFQYRSSIFNTSARGRYIILRVSYALEPGGTPRLDYADLKGHFAERIFASRSPEERECGICASLAEVREAVREIRRSKAMLIVEGDEDCRSAGSFFKNPALSGEAKTALMERAAARGLSIPSYPALNARHKVPAAWLVEHSGFQKGYTRGRVGISRKHALAIVNRGGATAAEVVALMREIQDAVAGQWGMKLQPEPVFVGF